MRQGDARAWEDAFAWLWPAAHGAAYAKLGSLCPGEVDDVAIESIEALAGMLDRVEDAAELRPLLASISYNRAASRIRWELAQRRSIGKTDPMENPPSDLESPISRMASLDQEELAGMLEEMGAKLKPVTLGILVDFFNNELSYKELAEKYQMPIGTVGTHIRRGLERLRELIEKNPKLLKEMEEFLR